MGAAMIALSRAPRVPSLPGRLHAFKAAMSRARRVHCLAQLRLYWKLSRCHTVCISSPKACMYGEHHMV